MGVYIDEAGRYYFSLCVNFPRTAANVLSNGRYTAVIDGDICCKLFSTGPVYTLPPRMTKS